MRPTQGTWVEGREATENAVAKVIRLFFPSMGEIRQEDFSEQIGRASLSLHRPVKHVFHLRGEPNELEPTSGEKT